MLRQVNAIGNIFLFGSSRQATAATNNLSTALAAIECAQSSLDIFCALYDYLPDDRFPYIALTRLSPSHAPVATSYPLGWGEEYLVEDHSAHDPVLALILRKVQWFDWTEAATGMTQDGARVMAAAADHGLRSGLAIPFHGPDNYHAVISLAGPKGASDLLSGDRSSLITLAQHAHFRMAALTQDLGFSISGDSKAALNSEEVAVLRWLRTGRKEDEVAELLGFDSHQMREHLFAARRKLGAPTRSKVLFYAIAAGYFGADANAIAPATPAKTRLTARMREVLAFLADDRKTDEIANILGISRRAVEEHIAAAKRRHSVKTIQGLIASALRTGEIN